MKITDENSMTRRMKIIAAVSFGTGVAVLCMGVYFSEIITNGFVLEYIGAFFCLFMWVYAVHCLYNAYNVIIIDEENIRTVRSPFLYMYDGDMTIKRNKNKSVEITDTLYITHTFGVSGAKIGDTYLILSNYEPKEYDIREDENAVIIYHSDAIIEALKENFDCCEINELRSVVEDKNLYRIRTIPQKEGYSVRRVMLRSPEDFSVFLVMSLPGVLLYFMPEEEMDYFIVTVMIGIVVTFIIYGCAYNIVTEDYISEIYFPYIPIKRIYFSDCAEIGLFSVEKESGRGGKYCVNYFYFSPRLLTDEERENITALSEKEYKKIIYNETLHAYLRDNLGIELKGSLMERKK